MCRKKISGVGVYILLCLYCACEPAGEEPAEVALPVVSDGRQLVAATNAEGWLVSLDTFDVCVANLEFTQEGEAHASLNKRVQKHVLKRISDFFVPEAMAHPGHLSSGDVTGTLDGKWVLSFLGTQTALGNAALLAGTYHGFNLTFCRADAANNTNSAVGVTQDNPIYGHYGFLAGTAQKGGVSVRFSTSIDIPMDPNLWGGVFKMSVANTSAAPLLLQPLTIDPIEGDTFFDGLDFGALDDDGDGQVTLVAGMPAHNILMKTLMSHDHWSVVASNR